MKVDFSVHKNTRERRHRKAMQAAMTKAAKDMGQRDIVAYAFVAIRSDGEALASWDTGAALPLWAFAPTIAEVLRKDIEASGVEEDWRPSLTERRLHKG